MEGGLAPDTMSGPDVHLWTPSDVINWCRSTLDQRYPGVSFAQMLDTWEHLHLIDGPVLLQMDALEWKEAVPSIGARRLLRKEVGALGGGRRGSRKLSDVGGFDAGRRGSGRPSESPSPKAGRESRVACSAPSGCGVVPTVVCSGGARATKHRAAEMSGTGNSVVWEALGPPKVGSLVRIHGECATFGAGESTGIQRSQGKGRTCRPEAEGHMHGFPQGTAGMRTQTPQEPLACGSCVHT